MVLERTGVRIVLAHSIDDADRSLPCDHACSLHDSVLCTLADDHVVVLGVVADLDDVRRNVCESSASLRSGVRGLQSALLESFLHERQSGAQEVVLKGERVVLLPQMEVVPDSLCSAPYCAFEAMRTACKPHLLQCSAVAEHS